MARIPNPVVGRTQPDTTPLALRRSTATAEAFGAGVFRALGGLATELQKTTLALRDERDAEAQLKANLDLSQFDVEQNVILKGFSDNAEEFADLGKDYSAQFIEKAQELLDRTEDSESKQNVFK